MTRDPRQFYREYLSCPSGGLHKIQMIDGGTLDLHQDLVACNGRLRCIAERQLPTIFQQSDSFHASSPCALWRCAHSGGVIRSLSFYSFGPGVGRAFEIRKVTLTPAGRLRISV